MTLERSLWKLERFEMEKKKVNEILSNRGYFADEGELAAGDNEELDLEIKDLVYKINSLPFVYTSGSCSGHFQTGEGERRLKSLPEGYGFYGNGELGLVFNPSHESIEYLLAIKNILKEYPNASIKKGFEDEREIHFDNLPSRDAKNLALPLRIPITEGIKRREEVRKLIKDLEKQADSAR